MENKWNLMKRAGKILLVLLILEMVLFNVSPGLYQTPMARIIKIVNIGAGEKRSQTITLIRENTEGKGDKLTVHNSYDKSQVKSVKYHIMEEVFLTKGGKIQGIRRDKYLCYLVTILMWGLIVLAGKKGLLTAFAMVGNGILFFYLVARYGMGAGYQETLYGMIGGFTLMTLCITLGITRVTMGAAVSSCLVMLATNGIYLISMKIGGEPPYELMEYITAPRQLDEIFHAGLMVGCLGAVMDVAVTMHATVAEMMEKNKTISLQKVIAGIRQVGYDVMGTMINVLFFTYLSAGIPLLLIKLKSGYSIGAVVGYGMIFDLIHFLVGAIGIVLAVPVAGFTAVMIEEVRRRFL